MPKGSVRIAPNGIASLSGANKPRHAADTSAKGRQVFIEGKIQTRQWDDRDGNKRYTTEIVARDVRFLGNRDSNNAGMSQGGQGGGYQGGYGGGQSDQGGQGGGYGGGQGGGQGGGYQQPKNQGYGGGQDFEPHAVTDDDVPF